MSADLPPDVRDRAAQRAQSTWLMRPSGGWLAVVDAVAEVLVAEPDHCPQCAYRRAQIEEPERYGVAGGRDALKARVAELSTEHLHLSHEIEALEEWNFWLSRTLRDMARRATSFRSSYYQTARSSTRYIMERSEARARVDLLTTALTGLVSLKDGPRDENYRTHKDDAWANARAVLSATPTEETP